MKRLAILFVLATCAAAIPYADVELAIDTGQAALVAQDTRFDPAVQLMSTLGVSAAAGSTFGAGFGSWALRFGASVGYAPAVFPITAYFGGDGSVVYRGIVTRVAEIGFEWHPTEWASAALAAGATLASYDSTSRLFFYPSIALVPGARLRLDHNASITWELPLQWHFRDDLAWAFQVGLRARLAMDISAP